MIRLLILALILSACGLELDARAPAPDKSGARVALESAGYTEIVSESTAWLGCPEEDSTLLSRVFRARSPGGSVVNVRVCCRLFWGCTIRR